MRVLSIVEVLGVGGAETVLVDLVTRLAEHDHVVWHLSAVNDMTAYGPHVARLEAAGVPVHDVHWRDVAEPARRAASLAGFIPDVVIAHWWGGDPWQRWVVERPPTIGQPRFVCVAHTSGRPLPRGFDRYVLVASAQRPQASPLRDADVRVIPNATDLERFDARSAAEDSTPDRALVVGSLAGLRPGKVGADWVRTIAGWDVADTNFRVAGDGPLRAQLESDAAAPALQDRFEFLGHVPASSVPQFLASLDVLCHLTAADVRESCPLAVIEALAAGVPVVALASGGLPELVTHGENGLLAASASEVGSHLRQLAADRQLVRRLAAGARAMRSRLGRSNQLAGYRQLLDGLSEPVGATNAGRAGTA